jgi:hypothetical protein
VAVIFGVEGDLEAREEEQEHQADLREDLERRGDLDDV